jgi:SAM-dependent methyltransferase
MLDSDYVEGEIVQETLTKMNALERFNRHLYQTIAPYCGDRILEVGSGTGNITRFLLQGAEVTATDVHVGALSRLQAQFSAYDGFSARSWDVAQPIPDDLRDGGFDTVVCLNVLEHVEDDAAALDNMRRALAATGGRLVLLVPAGKALYSPLDRGLGHFRRYEPEGLKALLDAAGFEVETTLWFNALGMLGWFVNGRLLQRERLPVAQLGIYERVAPLALPIERSVTLPFGLSLVAVARPRP